MRSTVSRSLGQTATELRQARNAMRRIFHFAWAPAPEAREAKERALQARSPPGPPMRRRASLAGATVASSEGDAPRDRLHPVCASGSERRTTAEAWPAAPRSPPAAALVARRRARFAHAVLAETRETTRSSPMLPHRFSFCFRGVVLFAARRGDRAGLGPRRGMGRSPIENTGEAGAAWRLRRTRLEIPLEPMEILSPRADQLEHLAAAAAAHALGPEPQGLGLAR